MKASYKKVIFPKSAIANPPQIETPVSVVDCNPTTMSMASGGQYVKRDRIHLDKSAKGESFSSLIPPRDIFDADRGLRGMSAYLREQINSVGSVENMETTSVVEETTPVSPAESLPLDV